MKTQIQLKRELLDAAKYGRTAEVKADMARRRFFDNTTHNHGGHDMKTRLITLSALLALSLLALPASAPAMCGYWKSECARFKAGKEVKSGQCDVVECENMHGEQHAACFVEKKCEDKGRWDLNGMYKVYRGNGHTEYYLEGAPATPQKKPLKGEGWTCFDKKDSNVTMCVKDRFDFYPEEDYPEEEEAQEP